MNYLLLSQHNLQLLSINFRNADMMVGKKNIFAELGKTDLIMDEISNLDKRRSQTNLFDLVLANTEKHITTHL